MSIMVKNRRCPRLLPLLLQLWLLVLSVAPPPSAVAIRSLRLKEEDENDAKTKSSSSLPPPTPTDTHRQGRNQDRNDKEEEDDDESDDENDDEENDNAVVVLLDFAQPHTDDDLAMETLDDPVMGGKSHSTALLGSDRLIWTGVVETVDFLNAPGFCTLQTVGEHPIRLGERLANMTTKTTTTTTPRITSGGLSFLIDGSTSNYFHPMGIQVENGRRTKFAIPVVYWSPATEFVATTKTRQQGEGDDDETTTVVEFFAPWTNFTGMAYGQNVDVPPLDNPDEISKIYRVSMTTYFSHETGPFQLELLSIIGRASSPLLSAEQLDTSRTET